MKSEQTQRVLITGSRGFTGRHLVKLLKELGYEVLGSVHHTPISLDEISCDITDIHAVKKMVAFARLDYVIHLAANSFMSCEDTELLYKVNLEGTLNLLQALKSENIIPKKVLIISTAGVYGPQNSSICEKIIPNPINEYAKSKLAMEKTVYEWFDTFPILILRPFNYTGVGQDERFLVPKIVSHFKQQKPKIELGNIHITRDFSDVREVVKVYAGLLKIEESSEIINICSGKGISLCSILEIMSKISGHQLEIEVNKELIRSNDLDLIGNNEKLKEYLGFAPSMSIEEILRNMYISQMEEA